MAEGNVSALNSMPLWYDVLLLSASAYQAWRGWRFQAIFTEDQNRKAERSESKEHLWTKAEKYLLRCLADALFYFVCCSSGFIALFVLWTISADLQPVNQISAGAAAVLVSLTVYGVLGVSGQLPHLLLQGKLFKP